MVSQLFKYLKHVGLTILLIAYHLFMINTTYLQSLSNLFNWASYTLCPPKKGSQQF